MRGNLESGEKILSEVPPRIMRSSGHHASDKQLAKAVLETVVGTCQLPGQQTANVSSKGDRMSVIFEPPFAPHPSITFPDDWYLRLPLCARQECLQLYNKLTRNGANAIVSVSAWQINGNYGTPFSHCALLAMALETIRSSLLLRLQAISFSSSTDQLVSIVSLSLKSLLLGFAD